MKAETFLQALLNRYSLVYESRTELLDHIFSFVGNGYEWKEGAIVGTNRDELFKEIFLHLPKKDVVRAEQSNVAGSAFIFLEPDYELYPLSTDSLIFKIPDNVREDWLAVAVEWIRYLNEHRTYTKNDAINDYTKKRYDECTYLLDELINRYLVH